MGDFEQQMIEQQQQEQLLINEEIQRLNDPVRRNVIMDDWRKNSKDSEKIARTAKQIIFCP